MVPPELEVVPVQETLMFGVETVAVRPLGAPAGAAKAVAAKMRIASNNNAFGFNSDYP